MPRIFPRILGLLHRSQRQAADQRFLRSSLHLAQKLLHLFRTHLVSHMDMIAEIIDKRAQFSNLIVIRSLVGPVQKGKLPPVILLGHGFICQKHKVLNQLGRHIPVVRSDLHGPSVFIQHHLRLRKIEIYGTPLMPLLTQDTGQLRHPLKQGNQPLIPSDLLRILFFQDLRYAGIAHALVHTDHRLRDLRIHHFPFCIYPHNTAQGQTVLPRVEGADPVGQLVGQHGDHPVRKVYTGSAL